MTPGWSWSCRSCHEPGWAGGAGPASSSPQGEWRMEAQERMEEGFWKTGGQRQDKGLTVGGQLEVTVISVFCRWLWWGPCATADAPAVEAVLSGLASTGGGGRCKELNLEHRCFRLVLARWKQGRAGDKELWREIKSENYCKYFVDFGLCEGSDRDIQHTDVQRLTGNVTPPMFY